MYRKSLAILCCSLSLFVLTGTHSSRMLAAAAAPQQANDGYVGADACKGCHTAQFDAWTPTKHQKAFGKLMGADRDGDKCIRCHVTGSAAMIAADGSKPRLPGVQCESCHGAGATHVEQAKAKSIVKGAITKTPGDDVCTKCHSEASPHYKPFFYEAMKGLVHTIKK